MCIEGKIKVAIADDHKAVRQGIRRLLEQSPEIKVVGEASNGQEAIRIVKEQAPDVLILDILMPVMDGITVIEMLQDMDVDTVVLVLSAIDDPVFKEESLLRGACSYLSKDQAVKLIDAIQQAAQCECDNSITASNPAPRRHIMIY